MSSENSDAEMPNADVRPPTNVGTFTSDRSNIGSRCTRSATTNAASSAAATTSEPITVVEPQPSSLLRISP